MSRNTETVERYLDGFRRNDHAQILSCLTDDIEWTVFGAFHLVGKEAYDAAIEGPGWVARPGWRSSGWSSRTTSSWRSCTARCPRRAARPVRLSMAEVFVMRDGLIAERRAWVIPLTENDHR